MGSVGQGTHHTLAWWRDHTPSPEVSVWKDQVSSCPESYALGALTDKCICVTVYPRVPYPAACYQTSLHLPALVRISRNTWMLISCHFLVRLRTAPTKASMFCMETGAFSSCFNLGAANLFRREEKTIGGLLFLALPCQDSSELILEIKLPGKGVSLTCIYVEGMRRHLHDFSSSIIRRLNYWLYNLIICRSWVIIFPYEKGT